MWVWIKQTCLHINSKSGAKNVISTTSQIECLSMIMIITRITSSYLLPGGVGCGGGVAAVSSFFGLFPLFLPLGVADLDLAPLGLLGVFLSSSGGGV